MVLMENQFEFIVRTKEQDKEFAKLIAQLTAEEILKRIPKREPLYHLSAPEIKTAFPGLKHQTLQRWATSGKVGKMGADGKYYVTLPEIEKALFPK